MLLTTITLTLLSRPRRQSGPPPPSRRTPPSTAARPALTLVRRVDQRPDPDPEEGPSSGCLGGHSPAGPVTLAFCIGFLLALIGVIVYIEGYPKARLIPSVIPQSVPQCSLRRQMARR
ncbi:hypothetical protein FJT64_018036 [Amphibalanus amphitrite]|uniref:Uncharacterized protein n=1 Tax=Amphibalanus amphitrite TaxID=1232801 RepID=A0A6A4WUA8_AMPAM|nr:hypothetical protein FJT64_018036 [Amphibalanus amphitrite]